MQSLHLTATSPELIQSPARVACAENSPFDLKQVLNPSAFVLVDCKGASLGLRESRPHWNWSENQSSFPSTVVNRKAFFVQLDPASGFVQSGLVNEVQSQLQIFTDIPDLSAGETVGKVIAEEKSCIDLHESCQNATQANQNFRINESPEDPSWAAMVSHHVQLGENKEAVDLYTQMVNSGAVADGTLYVTVLKACSATDVPLETGVQVHADVIINGLESDIFVGSTLVDMYLKSRKLSEAQITFNRLPCRNVVTWTLLIVGYSQHGQAEQALHLGNQMQQEGLQPNEVTFVALLKACASIGDEDQGKWIHDQVIERGLDAESFIGSSLVDMYGKCGNMEDAHRVFDRLPGKDLVSWSSLITGYANNRQGEEALNLFAGMVQSGIEPDRVTFISLIQACSSVVAFRHGELIHAHIIDKGHESDFHIGSTLISMYATCGSLESAQMLLQRLPVRNVVTWTAIIAGCALQSNLPLASQYFKSMQDSGFKPNDVTFLSLFSACSHTGQVEEASHHFKSLQQDYGLQLTLRHYNCMVDVLGRAGLLEEAEDLMESTPFYLNIIGWTSLLGSCNTSINVKLGERCFNRVLEKGGCASAYTMMSSIYASAGMEQEARQIQGMRKHSRVWKKPAKSYIEVENQLHSFVVGDDSHPLSAHVHAKLKSLSAAMKGPECLLSDVDSKNKEEFNCGHSEKLAIAFGLISTPSGTTIRVGKNLRVCSDCHQAAKFISKAEMREIIISDSYRVHQFKDGSCCCNEP